MYIWGLKLIKAKFKNIYYFDPFFKFLQFLTAMQDY